MGTFGLIDLPSASLDGLHGTDHNDPLATMTVEALREAPDITRQNITDPVGLQAGLAPILSQERSSNSAMRCSTKAAEGQTTSTGRT